MQFAHLLALLSATALVYFTPVYAAPSPVLQIRAADSVPSHLGGTATFYRAITGEEAANVAKSYVVGHSPAGHSDSGGDFSPQGKGGLYVFDNEGEAYHFGKCYSVTPRKKYDSYYIVKFQYTPNKSLKTKSFTKPNSEWEQLVKDSYAGKWHGFNVVEGPYSMMQRGKMVGAKELDGKNMLYQSIFIGADALKSLKVVSVTKVKVSGAATGCTIL